MLILILLIVLVQELILLLSLLSLFFYVNCLQNISKMNIGEKQDKKKEVGKLKKEEF